MKTHLLRAFCVGAALLCPLIGHGNPAPTVPCWTGTLSQDVLWRAADSPIHVCGQLAVSATLTIEPGVTVRFASGASLTVSESGALLADGAPESPILFTSEASALLWGGMTFLGAANSPTNRITHARIEQNSSVAIQTLRASIFLDHVEFAQTARPYLSLDASSFVVSNCLFPKPTAPFEPVHGSLGLKPDGHGVFLRNFFGGALGNNDLVDFTGGKRPGPILHFINNVFADSEDDGLDLDGTDAWIENNLFLRIHHGPATGNTASAISGGADSGATSGLTILRNIFLDVDHAVTAKEGNFYALLQNTIVRVTAQGGTDTAAAVLNLRDTIPAPTEPGRGFYLEDNLIWDAPSLARNYDASASLVTLTNNLLPMPWSGPGGGNITGDPSFVRIPASSELTFRNWSEAQVVRTWLRPRSADKGASLPAVSIRQRRVVPHVRLLNSDWPLGAGYIGFRWRINSGRWSSETEIFTPPELAPGTHSLEVSARLDSGLFQDDPRLGPEAATTLFQFHSLPRLSILGTPPFLTVRFTASAGYGYRLESSASATGPWFLVSEFLPTGSNRDEMHQLSPADPSSFFRLAPAP